MQHNESINVAIKENEIHAKDWELSELAQLLYEWVSIFNKNYFNEQPVPVPVISFEKTRITTFGHYVIGRNALGLKENINLNKIHLDRPLWDILATLLHEMCHSWQAAYGTPSKSWFHNKEFRTKIMSMGIKVDGRGYHLGITDPFISLMRDHGIEVNDSEAPDGMISVQPTAKPKGTSKLKKWSCGCTNIRVAVADIEAVCLKCGNRFILQQ